METDAQGTAPASPQASPPSGPAPAAPPAPESQIAPEAGAASEERSSNWFGNALRAFTGRGPRDEPEAAPPDEQAEGQRSDATGPADWQPPTWANKQEHDAWLYAENRRYADRQDTMRTQREQAHEAQARDARIADLEREKEEARSVGDTWTVGEKQDAIDAEKAGIAKEQTQSAALYEFVGQVRAETDAALLDPILRDLPQAVARKLVDDASARDERGALLMAADGQPVGITTTAARGQLVQAAIKAIKDTAREEGRAQARKDPVLRKELLAEFAKSPEAAEREPVEVGAAATGAGPRDMNDFMRSVRNRR